MEILVLSPTSCSTCSTCSTMWPASSFTVRNPGCPSPVYPVVSTPLFTMISVNVPSTSSASASAFSFFCFRFCILNLCLRCCFFCVGGYFLNVFNDLLVSFSSSSFSTRMFFVSLIPPFVSSFPFFCLATPTLFRRSDHESCHYTSVVTAHVDHVVGFSIFVVFQVSSLG